MDDGSLRRLHEETASSVFSAQSLPSCWLQHPGLYSMRHFLCQVFCSYCFLFAPSVISFPLISCRQPTCRYSHACLQVLWRCSYLPISSMKWESQWKSSSGFACKTWGYTLDVFKMYLGFSICEKAKSKQQSCVAREPSCESCSHLGNGHVIEMSLRGDTLLGCFAG